MELNPPNSSNLKQLAMKGLTTDIRALLRSEAEHKSARMSVIKKCRLDPDGKI